MFVWFVGASVFVVWSVLRDPQLDYRFVALGAVVVDPLDAAWGGAGPLHSIVVIGAVMAAVLVVARGNSARRRVLMALVFGLALHALLDFVWANPTVFWWPFAGGALPSAQMPIASRGLAPDVVLEVLGLCALVAWARGLGIADWPAFVRYLRGGPPAR